MCTENQLRTQARYRAKKRADKAKKQTVKIDDVTIDISGKDEYGIEKRAMTEDQFLGYFGVRSAISNWGIDKYGGANRLRLTKRQEDKLNEQNMQKQVEHSQKRNEMISKYNELIDNGTLRKPTTIEKSVRTAHGHPDLQATQAARRMLERRGYDWKTGKPLR